MQSAIARRVRDALVHLELDAQRAQRIAPGTPARTHALIRGRRVDCSRLPAAAHGATRTIWKLDGKRRGFRDLCELLAGP